MTNWAKPLAIWAVLALAGCNAPSFYREAGNMDTGDFGNATMQNTLIATGKMQPPMGHDKYDAPLGNRKLSGKYAASVMTGYVEGATRAHPGNTTIETQTNPAGGN